MDQIRAEIEVWKARERDYAARVADMEQRGVDRSAVERMIRQTHCAEETRLGLEKYLGEMIQNPADAGHLDL